MQRDRVRRAAARDEEVSLDVRFSERARELEDEPVEPLVRDQQVRSETDRRDPKASFVREPQGVVQLLERLGPGKRTRGTAGPQRREP